MKSTAHLGWTHHMLWVITRTVWDEQQRGWAQSPTLTRCWRIETYLRKRLKKYAVPFPAGTA